MDSPVRITSTEEPGPIDRVQNPHTIGLTEPTEFLAEERVVRPLLGQRLPQQALDCPVGFGDRCAVSFQRYARARLEVSEREFRRQV
jgi:hypothetical protein